jgi:flagellar biosynthesis activator protein FlaF
VSLYGVLRIGKSRMNAQSNKLRTVAENILNASTTGYQRASTEFSSLILASSQGAYNSGAPDLTRAGNFVVDQPTGNLVNAAGCQRMGYSRAGSEPSVALNSHTGLEPININSMAMQLEDASSECREREKQAFDRAIDLLKEAAAMGSGSLEGSEALIFVQRLWSILIDDLLNPENGLPETLRAELVSIGLWIMTESDLILQGRSDNYGALIDINSMIRDGLR